jgi:hypothetical protein
MYGIGTVATAREPLDTRGTVASTESVLDGGLAPHATASTAPVELSEAAKRERLGRNVLVEQNSYVGPNRCSNQQLRMPRRQLAIATQEWHQLTQAH